MTPKTSRLPRCPETLKTERAARDRLAGQQAEANAARERLAAIIDRALRDLHEAEQEQIDVKVRISVLENARASDTDKNATMQGDLASLEKTARELAEHCDTARSTVMDYQRALADLDETVAGLEQKIAALTHDRREALERANQLGLRRDSLAQRADNLRRMEEHFEGYSGSVRYVMNQYEQGKITLPGGTVCGTIYGRFPS